MLTYGDSVSNVDINALYEFHKSHGKKATITAINVDQRFGVIDIDKDGDVSSFKEKTESDGSWVNGGFMVLEPEVIDYIEGDKTAFEKGPLQKLSEEGQLKAYKHNGFWKCMDTKREKEELEALWESGKAPWKTW